MTREELYMRVLLVPPDGGSPNEREKEIVDACADILLPEISKARGETNLHLSQCMSQQKEIEELKANRITSEKTINSLMEQREQLRAQLAEQREYWSRHSVKRFSYYRNQKKELMKQLSQAQETIADFRSALEKVKNSAAGIYIPNLPANRSAMTVAHLPKSIGLIAEEALQKHPDSTEVKG